MREQCIELLHKEAIMLDVWSRQPQKMPPKSKSGAKAVIFAILAIVTWFVKNWAVNMRDASAESNRFLLILLMGLLGWACWAGLVVFVVLTFSSISKLRAEKKLAAEALENNRKLEQEKTESRRVYDELRNKVKEERKNHPELAGKHLFFDDPHPLEQTEQLVRGKRITGKGSRMAVDGELALEFSERGLRLSGFYAPKKALIGEVCKGLKSPMGNYALPIWDKAYIDAHPKDECLIYTIHSYIVKAAPTDNRESKIQNPAVEFSRFWTGDIIGGFVGSGVSDVKNLSKVADLRGLEKMEEMHKYYQTIHNNPQLTSGEGRLHGWNVMDYMRMGYVMVKADGSNQMLGVILPRQELDRTVFVYSLDLFYTEKEAKTQKKGWVMDIFRDVSDTRGLGPDINDALWVALVAEEGIVPPFDPLQQPVKNLSSAEWHAILRLQAVESLKNKK